MSTISMRDLLEAGVHFGHQTSRWNPRMAPYIYGARDGVHIINLGKTLRMFREALQFVSRTASGGGQILFIGTKRQAQEVIAEEASRAQMPYVTHRWLGGMLTNFKTIRQSLERLNEVEKNLAEGSVERLSKKEIITFERERDKLMRNLGGIRDMKGLPAAIFIVDPNRERIAIREARRLGLPIVGLCDTNCDPEEVDYAIPGNDDAIRAIRLFAGAIADAAITAAELAKKGGSGGKGSGGKSETFVSDPEAPATSTAGVTVQHRGRVAAEAPAPEAAPAAVEKAPEAAAAAAPAAPAEAPAAAPAEAPAAAPAEAPAEAGE